MNLYYWLIALVDHVDCAVDLSSFFVRTSHILHPLVFRTVLDEHDFPLSWIDLRALAVLVLCGCRIVQMTQVLPQFLICALSCAVVDDRRRTGVVLVSRFLDLVVGQVLPLLCAPRVIHARVSMQLVDIELICIVILVKYFIFMHLPMLAVIRPCVIQNRILRVAAGDGALDAVLEADLGVVDGVGECRCRTCLDPHVVLMNLECVHLADSNAVVVEVTERI